MQAPDAAAPSGGKAGTGVASIGDLCLGLFGIQVVWGLQAANTSRVFQTLGAQVEQLPLLWIAAPVTGLIVQPLVGRWSDQTGRRAPFIAVGSAATALAMVGMAAATTLAGAVAMLWLMTAAINVAMQPFRALAAERLSDQRRSAGFAVQAAFIGAGAVFASVLPWLLFHWFGVARVAPVQGSGANVRIAFVIGALVLLASVTWTLLRAARQYWRSAQPTRPVLVPASAAAPQADGRWGLGLMAGASAVGIGTLYFSLQREFGLLAVLAFGWGAAKLLGWWRIRRGLPLTGALGLLGEVAGMPVAMRRLAVTQFLTWFALFAMWVYLVPAVAARQFGASDPDAPGYGAAADWVGILFATQDGVAVVAALALPALIARLGSRAAHACCLAIGALGLLGFTLVDAGLLWLPAAAVGVAWASVLSAPYAMVATLAARDRIGTYMGIHNVFLVVPQLIGAAVLGSVLQYLPGADATAIPTVAAIFLLLAALSCLRWPQRAFHVQEIA